MKRLLTILIIGLIMAQCKKPYDPPVAEADQSVLVVEGTIAVGKNVENIFILSKLKTLQNKSLRIPENNAKITIVSSSGNTWNISESGNGVYKSVLNIPENDKYKLVIQTTAGKKYESSSEAVINTPEIDSVTWKQNIDLQLYVHTHDPSNNTRYYKWDFIETFERHSWYESLLDFVDGKVVNRPLGDQIHFCWTNDTSKSILINNTTTLDQDVISYQPIQYIQNPSDKLSVRYSILVRQLGLSKEAYNFWNILKKNTELTGTLFDPQPSKMPSNITCVNDKARVAVGYISVGKVTEKRIFIMNSAMNLWPYPNEEDICPSISDRPAKSIEFLKQNPSYVPAYFETLSGNLVIARKNCVDCRIEKGTNIKPSFW
jgi:hypothetical protein